MEKKAESAKTLQGMRILLVDDEFLIAIAIEETFREAGADVLTAGTLENALAIAAEEPLSAALLDIRLGRQSSEEIADVLAARAIPFIFYSGQPLPDGMRKKYADAQVLTKPIDHDTLIQAIKQFARR